MKTIYKKVKELTREQLQELKRFYYSQKHNGNVSYEELCFIDDFVSDREIFKEYDGTSFVDDDFACTCGIIAD